MQRGLPTSWMPITRVWMVCRRWANKKYHGHRPLPSDIMKKLPLLVLCIIDKPLKMGPDLLGIVYIRILSDSILSILDSLQVAIPVIKLDHIAEEDEAPVSVIRANALHLV